MMPGSFERFGFTDAASNRGRSAGAEACPVTNAGSRRRAGRRTWTARIEVTPDREST
jgi:hypothetical protein